MNKFLLFFMTCLGLLLIVACTPQAKPETGDSITGIVWNWQTLTEQSTGDSMRVDNPENYTIIFNADGTVEGKADCNSYDGTYSQEGGFTINVQTSTMAFCGENSLDQQFLILLGEVAAGGPDGAGGFALETAGGAQRLMFSNGGTAP